MGEVLPFRPKPKGGEVDAPMTFGDFMQAKNRPPAEVVPGPVDIQFHRWVRCMDVDRAAWSCLRHLATNGKDEAARWWNRHSQEIFKVGSKSMPKARIPALLELYRNAVRNRITEIRNEFRTRTEWELALAASRYLDRQSQEQAQPTEGRSDGVA